MILELAEKYCAIPAGLFVEKQIMKKAINGRIYDGYPWSGQYSRDQWIHDVLSLYIFAERLDLVDLVEIAAKLTLQLVPDVIKKIPDDLDRFLGRKEHLIPLMEFHQRWEKEMNQILKDPVYTPQEQWDRDEYEAHFEGEPLEERCGTMFCFTSRSIYYAGENDAARAIKLVKAFEDLKFEERYRPKNDESAEMQT